MSDRAESVAKHCRFEAPGFDRVRQKDLIVERRLFILQRFSAMLLAPMIIIHLGLILFAIRDGLSAAEILGRTQGNILWAIFYGLFVLTVAIHAPIGVRKVLQEWAGLPTSTINSICWCFALLLLVLGFRAVAAVV